MCSNSSYSSDRQKTEEEKVKKAVSNLFATGVATNEEAAKNILGILFPKMNLAFVDIFLMGAITIIENFNQV